MQEETNRVVADHLSDVRFCPTRTAVENLRREGIASGVHLVDDVMEEALRSFLPIARARGRALDRLSLAPRGYVLATLHRAESVDDRGTLADLLAGLERIARPVVWPCHPRTRLRLREFGLHPAPSVCLIEPVGYLDMLQLEDAAEAILTDSGGVQREAAWLGVPCLVLRDETEWVEALGEAHVLAGRTPDGIACAYRALPNRRRALPAGPAPAASQQILGVLTGLAPAPAARAAVAAGR
jgi:UDP-N-acetylglucosamine 2-epimerase